MTRRNAFVGLLGWAMMSMVASVWAQGVPVRNAQGLLVGSDGHALYAYDADTSGHSACNGPCLVLWPAYAAPGIASPHGDFSVIARADGARQWAFRGKPLYRYAADQKPGDALGDGMNGTWHTLR